MSDVQEETRYDFKAGTRAVTVEDRKLPRVGIYSGGFDPVHAGHIVFALKSQKIAGLERIYFVPERRPAYDSEPEHYVHRRVMLKSALRPYRQFEIFDLPDARLNARSLTRVIRALPQQSNISLLTTAGALLWREGELPPFYRRYHLIVAVTSHAQMAEVLARLAGTGKAFGNITFVDIGTDHISSTAIRQGIRTGNPVRGILPSVWRYARKQWLYVPPIRHNQGR